MVEDVTVRPDLPGGTYGVEIGLLEGERPIELALRQNCKTGDGFYRIGTVEVREQR